MKKTIKNSLRIVACMILFISCDDYLDIQPEDKFIEEQVFSSGASVQNAINGIYMDMAKASTYGGHLTMSTVDVLAQKYFAFDNKHAYYDLSHYNYDQTGVKNTFDVIWTNMYARILNINKAIENLELNTANIAPEKLNILKGEMFGLRAMLHFDLLRLFGPVYSINSGAISIPYYDESTTDINPLLPATEVMGMVLNDLSVSIGLLGNDPVREYGKIDFSEENDVTGYNGTDYYRYRNLRFNYFSAKALSARANLYAGNNQDALMAAKEVIDEGMQWFEWVNPDDVVSAGDSADRVFSSEVIFALQNVELYDRQKEYFAADLNDKRILAPASFSGLSRLDETFDGNLNDFRYSPSWKVPTNSTKAYETFLKFQDVGSSFNFRYMQPLVRMSEMYLIVAETEADLTMATVYLNTLREHRGLANLDPTLIDLGQELLKEYKREFYGEGQLFYFYKRNNMSSIEDGSDTTGEITMDETTYVLPIPESETDYRED